MGQGAGRSRFVAVSRIALVGLIGGAAAACTTDSARFSEPFANPFASSARVASSQPQDPNAQVAAYPAGPVQAQPLPAAGAPRSAAPVTSAQGGWTATGGTRITVAHNDDINQISQRYGVPTTAILSANNLSSPKELGPGREIVIPVYSASAAPTRIATAPAVTKTEKLRFVEGPKPAGAKMADAGKSDPKARVRPGMVAKADPKAKPGAAPAPQLAKVEAKPLGKQAPIQVAAKVDPAPAKPAAQAVAAPQAAPPAEVAKAPIAEPEQTGALGTDFRWPARGRVIAGFGANGGNEGINIAVPEGTPVKATEAGTVTYAGSEVKGYGNLVLIRHDNGYVSAYAHNGSLGVKRGEKVKRGQVIATSGQSGNVTSPQLHFEIRKGQTPVDPISHLSSN